jgi:hypothetical protein
MDKYNLRHINAFSKDTFVLATYYNTKRNGNITFENALWLTTDVGETWKMIYQDSVAIIDFNAPPKFSQTILDVDVNDNSVISFLREDGYIFFSRDYGQTWDSVSTPNTKKKYGKIAMNKNKLVARFYNTDTLYYLDIDTKAIESIYMAPAEDNLIGEVLNLVLLDDDNIIYSTITPSVSSTKYTHITEDRGKTWTLYPRPNYAYDYYFVDSKLGYSCGETYLEDSLGVSSFASFDKTTDGGKTWENMYKGEKEIGFTDLAKNRSSFVCIARYEINPWSTSNFIDWEVDSIGTPVTDGGAPLDITCDDYGNCLMIQRTDNIQRTRDPQMSVRDGRTVSNTYQSIEYYDMRGNNLTDVINEGGMSSGFYMKVYKNRYGNIVKTEKLIIAR